MLGGGGGGFYSSGRSSKQFGGSTGFGGEGGKGFLQGGVGGKAKYNNAEVSEEAAVLMEMEGVVEAEEATLEEVAEIMKVTPVGEGEDPTMLEKINRVTAVIKQLDMVR